MRKAVVLFICLLMGIGALGLVWAQSQSGVEDAFYIRSNFFEGKRLRPPVEFTHQNHVENYASDCTDCHHEHVEGEPIQKCSVCHTDGEATEALTTLKDAMHKNCVECHRLSGGDAPTKCHECHGQIDYYDFQEGRTKPSVVFTHLNHWKKYNTPCTSCHHRYENGENVWKRGDPIQKCNTCHQKEDHDGVVKLKTAFHRQCKGCHKNLVDAGKEVPYRCTDCHYHYKDKPYAAFPKPEKGKDTERPE